MLVELDHLLTVRGWKWKLFQNPPPRYTWMSPEGSRRLAGWWFQPLSKNMSQFGNLPQHSGWKFQKYVRNHHLIRISGLVITPNIPHLGVSKNSGTPKWMVYNGKSILKWMIWGYPWFWKLPNRSIFVGATPLQPTNHHPRNHRVNLHICTHDFSGGVTARAEKRQGTGAWWFVWAKGCQSWKKVPKISINTLED